MIPTTAQIENKLIPRLLNKSETSSTDTTVVRIVIGNTQPTNDALWFDTSDNPADD